MAQITNPNWAPRFPWALLHGEQNTKSFRKKNNKTLPRPAQFLLQCPGAPGLGLLYP